MKRVGLVLLLVVLGLLFAACTTSEQESRETDLTPGEEVVTPDLTLDDGSEATPTGTVTAILSADKDSLNVSGSYSGLTGPATGAHIHFGEQGVDGPVVCGLDVSDDDEDGEGTVSGICDVQENVAEPNMQDAPIDLDEYVDGENYYVNIHTDQNGGGEIRGQLD